MKWLCLLAHAIWRSLQVHRDAVGDASENVARWASEDALRRQRMQCQRNALALAGLQARFEQGAAECKTYTLAELVHRRAQHADRHGGVVADPAVNMPLSNHVRRDMVRVVLDHASEAEYEARYTTPVTGDLFAGGANTS